MKRLLTLALCAAGFVLLTAASDYLRGTRALTINGRPFGNAVLVNGVWSVPLDDVEKNIDAKFTVLGNRLEIARDPASAELTFRYDNCSEPTCVPHEVWFQDAESYRAKVNALLRGHPWIGGFAMWRAGSEDPSVWNDVGDLNRRKIGSRVTSSSPE